MQIFAQLTNDGTAMSETAVCAQHLASHRNHLAVTRDSETGAPLRKFAFIDCGDVDGGNDQLACNVCGVDIFTPDLRGKTVSAIEAGSEPGERSDHPATTLRFTDGTVHTFVHP